MYDIASKKMLVMGQASLLLFALILAFIPQYYIVVFILYLAVMFGLGVVAQRRGGLGKKDIILSGREYFREEKAMEIAWQDKELMTELSAQTKLMGLTFLGLIIAFGVFWAYGLFKEDLIKLFSSFSQDQRVQLFFYWVTVFETIFVFNRGLTLYIYRGRRVQQPLMPSKYVVTDKGIASSGLGGIALQFPLPEDVEISFNTKRKFVEIKIKKNQRIRFYTKNPQRLYDLIVSLNKRAKMRSENTEK